MICFTAEIYHARRLRRTCDGGITCTLRGKYKCNKRDYKYANCHVKKHFGEPDNLPRGQEEI